MGVGEVRLGTLELLHLGTEALLPEPLLHVRLAAVLRSHQTKVVVSGTGTRLWQWNMSAVGIDGSNKGGLGEAGRAYIEVGRILAVVLQSAIELVDGLVQLPELLVALALLVVAQRPLLVPRTDGLLEGVGGCGVLLLGLEGRRLLVELHPAHLLLRGEALLLLLGGVLLRSGDRSARHRDGSGGGDLPATGPRAGGGGVRAAALDLVEAAGVGAAHDLGEGVGGEGRLGARAPVVVVPHPGAVRDGSAPGDRLL